MFEKEAIEYVYSLFPCFSETRDEQIAKYVKDGIMIGYNKANEWNFVKDGKFPAEKTECLCIVRPLKEEGEPFGNSDFRAVLFYRNGRFYLEENDNNDSLLYETNSDFTELVVAWKEIVLPKEKDY